MEALSQGAEPARLAWVGLALVVLGLLAVALPLLASLLTSVVLGILMIIAGFVEGQHVFAHRGQPGSTWRVLSALVQIVGGIFVVAFPVAGKLAITLILAWYFAAEGVLRIIRALSHRRARAGGWLAFDGLLSLALAILILAHWPSSAVWVLGLFVGIHLVISGASMLMLAMEARSEARV